MEIVPTDKPFSVFSLEADRDYLLARLINFSGQGFAPRAGYFAQQACEKYLKALTVQEERIYLKTHNLIDLTNYCSKYDPIFSNTDFIKNIQIFDDFREVGRYGAESTYDPKAQKNDKFQTAGVYIWIDDNIKILDKIVKIIRNKLNYKKIDFSDSLDAIINNNDKDFLVANWRLPISIKQILTSHNNDFK